MKMPHGPRIWVDLQLSGHGTALPCPALAAEPQEHGLMNGNGSTQNFAPTVFAKLSSDHGSAPRAQHFRHTPCLRDASARRKRRVAFKYFTQRSQTT
jgi:hypothetical protein